MKNNQFVPYFGLIAIAGLSFFSFPVLSWILFIIGLLLGFYFHYFDFLLFPLYADSENEVVKAAKKYLEEKNYLHYWQVIWLNQDLVTGLISKSLIFLLAYFPLAVFVISTSRFAIGKGLVLGLGWHLVWQLFILRGDVNKFNLVFRGGPDQKLSQPQISQLVVIFCLLFLALVAFSLTLI